MAGSGRGGDKKQRKRRACLTDEQKTERSKKIAATNAGKAAAKAAVEAKKKKDAKRSFVQSLLGRAPPTSNDPTKGDGDEGAPGRMEIEPAADDMEVDIDEEDAAGHVQSPEGAMDVVVFCEKIVKEKELAPILGD